MRRGLNRWAAEYYGARSKQAVRIANLTNEQVNMLVTMWAARRGTLGSASMRRPDGRLTREQETQQISGERGHDLESAVDDLMWLIDFGEEKTNES